MTTYQTTHTPTALTRLRTNPLPTYSALVGKFCVIYLGGGWVQEAGCFKDGVALGTTYTGVGSMLGPFGGVAILLAC